MTISVTTARALPKISSSTPTPAASRNPRLIKLTVVAVETPITTQTNTSNRQIGPRRGPAADAAAVMAPNAVSSMSPAARQPRAVAYSSAARSAARQAGFTAPP